jgi:dGTPase
VVAFTPQMAAAEKAIKSFLYAYMYRAPSVMRIRENAQIIVRDLFLAYSSGEAQMPNDWGMDWRDAAGRMAEEKRVRLVADFIAGMTDRYAISEHQRLFDATPELR